MSTPSEPLVTALICNYNHARYLPEAIDSVLAQTYRNIELIVVDDGSTDNSPDIIRSYGNRLRCIRKPNGGISAARNTGIAQSRGSLIATLDSDDAWFPTKIERQVKLFSRPSIGMVYSGRLWVDSEGAPLQEARGGLEGRVLRDFALLNRGSVPAGGSTPVITRECFDKVGLYDEVMTVGGDWDLWRRIACHYEIAIDREPLIRYRIHATNMHKRLDLYERDKLRAFAAMFADPAAAEVHPLRRQCYANLYLMLSGSFWHAAQRRKALTYGMRAVATWPPAIRHLFDRSRGQGVAQANGSSRASVAAERS